MRIPASPESFSDFSKKAFQKAVLFYENGKLSEDSFSGIILKSANVPVLDEPPVVSGRNCRSYLCADEKRS